MSLSDSVWNDMVELRQRLHKTTPTVVLDIGGHEVLAEVVGTRGGEIRVKCWVHSEGRWTNKPSWKPISTYKRDATPADLLPVLRNKSNRPSGQGSLYASGAVAG